MVSGIAAFLLGFSCKREHFFFRSYLLSCECTKPVKQLMITFSRGNDVFGLLNIFSGFKTGFQFSGEIENPADLFIDCFPVDS
ncbi:MAG TPA: hypothetical protein VJ904_10495, partial [Tichowtungia sp.]|nr:hypothetical protein [Tichowtungia sp.]